MQIVFIIFGLIILVSFITGAVLTLQEKKNKTSLTDDPKILFEEEKKDIVPLEVTSNANDEVVVSEQANNVDQERFIVETPVLQTVQDVSASNSDSVVGTDKIDVLEHNSSYDMDLQQEDII